MTIAERGGYTRARVFDNLLNKQQFSVLILITLYLDERGSYVGARDNYLRLVPQI